MEYLKYIPAWNGNREKDYPITVEIKPLTRRDIQAYAKQIKRKLRKGFRDDFTDNAAEIQERQFFDNVGKIENLTNFLTHQAITTAEQLYDAPGMTVLITEIIDAMEDASTLGPDEIKNSGPPSAGD